MLRRTVRATFVVLSLVISAPAPRANDLTHFESAPVHPVEISPSATRLFVAHTADHRLVVFETNAAPLHKIAEVMVGLEPVTVRARSENEVWVVNHVSDDQLAEWYRLVLQEPAPTGDPLEAKLRLARWIVARSHGEEAAKEAEGHFTRVVREGKDGHLICVLRAAGSDTESSPAADSVATPRGAHRY